MPNNPFKGPLAYEENDQFYGREKEQDELYNLIDRELLTLLFAKSGIGKTSLLKAGLIPFLRKEFNYFPIYIHLDESAVLTSSATDLADYVIKTCLKEFEKHKIENPLFNYKVGKRYKQNSLFEFILNLELNQKVINDESVSETNVYQVRPVLIFDQLEEIFTLKFDYEHLDFLIKDINYLLESQLPKYLEMTFREEEKESYLKLKRSLLSRQKSFRLVLSFREEYLPNFESLKEEFSAIQYTTGRYRLEPFEPQTAAKVITDTAPEIPADISNLIVQNLSIKILKNFHRIIVEPFLLSLVCFKIYEQLVSPSDTHTNNEDWIKGLVENAIENYVDDIYKNISEKTQVFIETELLTSDNQKDRFNYNSIIDPELGSDIKKLITNPNYRLLYNKQFLDAYYIEILHDRLLPPIIKHRDNRLQKIENERLAGKHRQLEEENREKQKQNLLKTFALAAIAVLFIGIAFLYIRNLEKEEANKAKTEIIDQLHLKQKRISLDSANLSQKISDLSNTTQVLKAKKDSLFLISQRNDSLLHRNDSLLVESNNNNKELSLQAQKLNESNRNKNAFLSFFKAQSDSLIAGLQKTNPFHALAIAQSNYHKVNTTIDDTSIVNKFKRTYLETYNKTTFFHTYDDSIDYSNSRKISNNELCVAKTFSKNYKQFFLIAYNLDKKRDVYCDTLLNRYTDTTSYFLAGNVSKYSPNDFGNFILTYGFNSDKNIFYAITRTGNKDSIFAWKLKKARITNTPYLAKSFDYKPTYFQASYYNSSLFGYSTEYYSDYFKSRGNNIFFITQLDTTRSSFQILTYNLQNADSYLSNLSFESDSESFYDISENRFLVTVNKTNNQFRLYDFRENYSKVAAISQLRYKPSDLFFCDTTLVGFFNIQQNHSSFIKFMDTRGFVQDSLLLQRDFIFNRNYLFKNKFVLVSYVESPGSTFGNTYKTVVVSKVNSAWQISDSSDFALVYSIPYSISFSHDGKSLALANGLQTVTIINTDMHSTKNIMLYPYITFDPVLTFSANDSTILITSFNKTYKVYFKKPNKIYNRVSDLESFLTTSFFENDWPIAVEDKRRYGIK